MHLRLRAAAKRQPDGRLRLGCRREAAAKHGLARVARSLAGADPGRSSVLNPRMPRFSWTFCTLLLVASVAKWPIHSALPQVLLWGHSPSVAWYPQLESARRLEKHGERWVQSGRSIG
ncbi:hypothetical protein BU23DRAFT_561714 [Bimuria novae-zelandiae CBS 107.79]|uniref:Uncharacterized protein n=1 Tax=Bimuria novae-zelandiae CBS 107.79 TaxID=1447943 RepID=A0A6A5UI11_9PLEO|nr:hypothetical protein BU23DRAFT_561920 [Bimuria novae-zelandiae CBS 107.79]KAF1964747.1 hypothetical protein BU23DRAFT_561714 [Bimuria novae-zelandiae CBS 107.79]